MVTAKTIQGIAGPFTKKAAAYVNALPATSCKTPLWRWKTPRRKKSDTTMLNRCLSEVFA